MCGGTGLYLESILRNYKMLHVPVNQELREGLTEKSQEELTGMLKLYGPPHNITDTVNRKRVMRAIEIAMYQSKQGDEPNETRILHPLVLGIRFERVERRKRITERLKERLEEGLVKEVEQLLYAGVPAEKMDYYGLEYRYVNQYLQKEYTYDEMYQRLNTAIHQFAKRQMTYFRGMERRGIQIHWLDGRITMQEKVEKAMGLISGAMA
jgi:tRNA dimethylallyltransferase